MLGPTPVWAAVATQPIQSARSGAWSSPATWAGGKIPATGDRVLIRAEDHVTLDLPASPEIRSINVCGRLSFALDRDTCLNAGLITVQPGTENLENGGDPVQRTVLHPGKSTPTLEVGMPDKPLNAGHTARIRLVFFPGMDKESCPAIICSGGGRMEFHGSPMNHTWVKLRRTANEGDTTVVLFEAVIGWRIGDHVIVTATERDRGGAVKSSDMAKESDYATNAREASDTMSDQPLTEERTIIAISGDNLTLDQPLAHHHLGDGAYRAEVANLSRNVIVESSDPDGVRGHTMYHRGSAGSISYAEFRHLAKKGVLGRYPIHFHRVGDTMRGSSVIGASIWDSDNRWLAVHATNYLVVRDCVGYQSVGHGFYLEDGTETCNVFDHNLAVRASAGRPLPNQSLPFDENQGAGFWWANCLNTFTRNVACDCDRYGYRFEASPANGFDLKMPVRLTDGMETKVDIRTLPFIRFEGNEAHGMAYGLNLGQESIDRPGDPDRHSGIGPDRRHPFVIRDTRIWNTRWGIRAESPSLLIDGLDIHGSVYGFYRAKFVNHAYNRLTISNVAITEAFGTGVLPVGLELTDSGRSRFDHVGAPLTSDEMQRFRNLLRSSTAEMSPADAERLVRSSYNTGGMIQGHAVPRIFEDAMGAENSGVSCGPISSEAFPKPLSPVEDMSPVTVIPGVQRVGADHVRVRGTTVDDGAVRAVKVNGQTASAVAPGFAQWEITLPRTSGAFMIRAIAEDAAGNIEKTPHVLKVDFSN